jgi:methylated-DNA-[protein]-cysteine S-methyltransferase
MVYYSLVKLALGEVVLVWQLFARSPQLIRVLLPAGRLSALTLLRQSYQSAKSGSHPLIESICRKLEDYDRGGDISFPLPVAASPPWSEFYQRVWTETSRIPRGKVRTYGQLASNIYHPRAARAVGTALGANPFPLLIPCHRVIRSNGELGNYSAGGPAVKQRLLEMEGVFFNKDKIIIDTVVYLR